MIPRAIHDTLGHLWKSLDRLGVPMALMGGMAMSAWNYVRATKDVDLLVGINTEDQQKLLSTLQASGFRFKQSPPIRPLGDMRLLRLLYDPPGEFIEIQADLLLADSQYHQEALQRRKTVHIQDPDMDVCVLSCEDLLIHKFLAGRLIDRADVVVLLQANHATLDWSYMTIWLHRLGLRTAMTEAWDSAFPGTDMPTN